MFSENRFCSRILLVLTNEILYKIRIHSYWMMSCQWCFDTNTSYFTTCDFFYRLVKFYLVYSQEVTTFEIIHIETQTYIVSLMSRFETCLLMTQFSHKIKLMISDTVSQRLRRVNTKKKPFICKFFVWFFVWFFILLLYARKYCKIQNIITRFTIMSLNNFSIFKNILNINSHRIRNTWSKKKSN